MLCSYLKFSEPIRKIMVYWGLGMEGVDAYRQGFCLSKLVTTFTPIWLLDMANSVFLTPSIMLLMSTPQYQQAIEKLRKDGLRFLPRRCMRAASENAQDRVDKIAEDAMTTIATVMVRLTTSMTFGLWSPLLLLIACGLAPLFAFALQFIEKGATFETLLVHCPQPNPNLMFTKPAGSMSRVHVISISHAIVSN